MDSNKIGYIYISSSMNNVIVSITNSNGEVLKQMSPGRLGYKKSKRRSSFAGQMVMNNLVDAIYNLPMKEWKINLRGFGQGRDGVLKVLAQITSKKRKQIKNITITEIRDVTPLPHNGCRAKSPRRI